MKSIYFNCCPTEIEFNLNIILKVKNIINYLKVSNLLKVKKTIIEAFLVIKLFTWLNTENSLVIKNTNDLQFFFKTFFILWIFLFFW